MDVAPGHMGDMRVCVEYAGDSPKRQKEAMKTGRKPPSSFQQVSWFMQLRHYTGKLKCLKFQFPLYITITKESVCRFYPFANQVKEGKIFVIFRFLGGEGELEMRFPQFF